jgi:hypothetical protein
VEGKGIQEIDGEYLFAASRGGTLATYRLGIDPGVPLPGIIARALSQGVMRGSVKDLRDEVERRAASR